MMNVMDGSLDRTGMTSVIGTAVQVSSGPDSGRRYGERNRAEKEDMRGKEKVTRRNEGTVKKDGKGLGSTGSR